LKCRYRCDLVIFFPLVELCNHVLLPGTLLVGSHISYLDVWIGMPPEVKTILPVRLSFTTPVWLLTHGFPTRSWLGLFAFVTLSSTPFHTFIFHEHSQDSLLHQKANEKVK
jgi:hypothetical protein